MLLKIRKAACAAPHEGLRGDSGIEVYSAGAGGAQKALMAGKAQHVYAHGGNIYGYCAGALGGINHHYDVILLCLNSAAYGGDILNGAGNVGAVGAHHHLGVGFYRLAEVVRIAIALAIRLDHSQLYDSSLFEMAQGTHYGVMLHAGGYNVVAALQHCIEHAVQRLGYVLRKGYLLRQLDVEKPAEVLPGVKHYLTRLHAAAMAATSFR